MAVVGQVKKIAGRPLFPVFGTAAAAYDPDAQAYFNALSVQPSSTQKGYINDFFVGAKSDGFYSLLDAFWMESNGDAQGATINGKNPATFTLLPVNSPTYTAGLGYAGNGSTSYLNTQYTPSTAGGNYTLNAASMGGYLAGGTDSSGIFFTMGATDGTNISAFAPWRESNNVRVGLNQTGTAAGVGPSSTRLGWTSVSRTSSTQLNGYRNATKLTGTTMASNALTTMPVWLAGTNSNGTLANAIDNRIPFSHIGGGLSDAQQLALYNRVITYLTAIGAN